MTDWLSEYVQNQMQAIAREFPHLKAEMAEAGGVMLYGTIGSAAFLRPDGTIVVHAAVDWVNEPETYEWHEATGKERWGALVLGARRMPELKALLPKRALGTPDCLQCKGSGFIHGGIVCPDCGGLGWVAPGAA